MFRTVGSKVHRVGSRGFCVALKSPRAGDGQLYRLLTQPSNDSGRASVSRLLGFGSFEGFEGFQTGCRVSGFVCSRVFPASATLSLGFKVCNFDVQCPMSRYGGFVETVEPKGMKL